MSSTKSSNEDFPSELKPVIADFHTKLTDLDTQVVQALANNPEHKKRVDIVEDLSPAEKAKLDIVSCFALNSLAWLWLRTQGQDPKESEVKGELDRVKSCMQRLKEIELKNAKHPKVDQRAAKRFVKSGLWQPKKKDQEEREGPSRAKKSRK